MRLRGVGTLGLWDRRAAKSPDIGLNSQLANHQVPLKSKSGSLQTVQNQHM